MQVNLAIQQERIMNIWQWFANNMGEKNNPCPPPGWTSRWASSCMEACWRVDLNVCVSFYKQPHTQCVTFSSKAFNLFFIDYQRSKVDYFKAFNRSKCLTSRTQKQISSNVIGAALQSGQLNTTSMYTDVCKYETECWM